MSRGLKFLRALGVSLLAIAGLTAIGAATVQAENEFLVNGKTLASLGGEESVGGSISAGVLLHESELQFTCAKGTFSGIIESGGKGKVQAAFGAGEKCKIGPQGNPDYPHCWISGPIVGSSVFQTLLHEGQWYLLLEGFEGESFTEFTISGDTLCPLEEAVVEVWGKAALLIDEAEVSQAAHKVLTINLEEEKLVEELIPGELGLFSLFGSAHFTSGSAALVALTGVRSGKNWSISME